MNSEEFWKILTNTGRYKTPVGGNTSWIHRFLGQMDSYFYFRLFLCIWEGYRTASSNKFNNTVCVSISRKIMSYVEMCGGKMVVEGVENLVNLKGPVVYISNHMSMLETMLLPGIVMGFGELAIIVKESLLKYPVFGGILREFPTIGVTRNNPRHDFKEVMEKGVEHLSKGRSLLVFPQATRSLKVDENSFNTLGVKVAKRAGVPVVPIALKTDFQGIGRIFRDIGRLDRSKIIHFKFGNLLYVDKNEKEVHAQVVDFILNNLREWENNNVQYFPGEK